MHISSKKKISDCQGLGRMERRKAENRDFRAEGTLYNSIMVGMPLYSCQNQWDTQHNQWVLYRPGCPGTLETACL